MRFPPQYLAPSDRSTLLAVAITSLPWLVIALFSFWYLRLAMLNYLHFDTGLDLGIYNQAMYHLSHARLPASTLKEQVLWGDHASFILALLVPLYRLFPDPRTLLVVQALAITTSGWAIYTIARKALGSVAVSLAILVSYLSFIGIQRALDFDFHVAVLTGAALAWTLYGMILKRPLVYWTALVVGLLTKEDAAPVFLMLGLSQLFIARRRATGLATAVISLVYFLIVGFVLMPVWTPGHVPLAHADVGSYGPGPGRVIVGVLSHPVETIRLLVDHPTKVETLRTLFAAFGFIPLLSPLTVLTSAPIFFSRFLSAEEYRWTLDYHYNANIAPLLTVGAILGAGHVLRLVTRRSSVSAARRAITTVLVVLFLTSAYVTAWKDNDVPLRKLSRPEFIHPTYIPQSGVATFYLVKEIIPPEGGISAVGGFVPHLSSRKYIYNFPTVNEKTDWIVLSPEFNTWPLRRGEVETAIAELQGDPSYELLWREYGIWAFKRRTVTQETGG